MSTPPLAAAASMHRHRLFGWTLSVLALGLLFGALPTWLSPEPELERDGLERPALSHEAALAHNEAPSP